MKDNFSINSDRYAKYRPTYPTALFDFLYSKIQAFEAAWDVGCGNGQVASVLSQKFKNVFATDISAAQIAQAPLLPNVEYSVQPAEQTNFSEQKFDLICVAQAIHWFDFERFYKEVKRVAKPGAVITAFGYGLFSAFPEADVIIREFYTKVIGPYWDAERHYIDEAYETIPFPFEQVADIPNFEICLDYNLEDVLGYLSTWSALKHYRQKNEQEPLEWVSGRLERVWKEVHTLHFPVFMKMAYL